MIVACPHCGERIANDLAVAERLVRCPHCDRQMRMPPLQAPPTVAPMARPARTDSHTGSRASLNEGAPARFQTLSTTPSIRIRSGKGRKRSSALPAVVAVSAGLVVFLLVGAWLLWGTTGTGTGMTASMTADSTAPGGSVQGKARILPTWLAPKRSHEQAIDGFLGRAEQVVQEGRFDTWLEALYKTTQESVSRGDMLTGMTRLDYLFKNDKYQVNASRQYLARVDAVPFAALREWTESTNRFDGGGPGYDRTNTLMILVGTDRLFSGSSFDERQSDICLKRLQTLKEESVGSACTIAGFKNQREMAIWIVVLDEYFAKEQFDQASFEQQLREEVAARGGPDS